VLREVNDRAAAALLRAAAALPARLFLDRPLGRRPRLEALVRDRLAALDRKPVFPSCKSLLGPLYGSELFAKIVEPTGAEFVFVEVRRLIAEMLVAVAELRVFSARCEIGELALDARSLGGKQLTCASLVHCDIMP
jgi:hypothetical protein